MPGGHRAARIQSWLPPPSALAAAAAAILLGGCGGAPPAELGGMRLGMTQQEVLDAVRARGGFSCRLRAARPKLTVCEGPAEGGALSVVVEGDSVVRLGLRLDAGGQDARRAVRRFVKPFGDPAWRDRPLPPRASPPEGYHTLWLDADSTLGIALVCAGSRLEPPCTAELAETSPARVQARLDSLLGIVRRADDP